MKKLAPLLVLMAGILWGLIGVFVRRLNTYGFASMEIVVIRSLFTAVLMFVFLLFFDKKMLKIKPKDVWCFLGTGILSIVFFNYCYFRAISIMSLSIAAILLYTAPAIVMILSAIIFHEKITLIKVASIIVTFIGCVFVTGAIGNHNVISVSGILVGLGAGLGYALYSIFSRFAIKRGYHSLTITFYTFLFAIIGAYTLADKKLVSAVFFDLKLFFFCIAFALISTVLPYIVYTLGLKDMENSKASVIASIEPVTATLLGVIAYSETLTLQQIVGVILVLLAIAMSQKN